MLEFKISSSKILFFFQNVLKIITIRIEKSVPINVILSCPAPQPKPVAMIRNKYTNSSGSFIAALNLTIERAPTKPRERANDDLTIVITKVVVKPKIIKFFEKSNLFESEFENFK